MNEEAIPQPSPGLKLSDIYYVLFRHKWKILLISVLGVGIAAALPFIVSRPYQSDARIFIRYVLEERSPAQTTGDSRVKSPDEGGASVINSEIAILTSLDLAQQVADSLGPQRILGRSTGTGSDDRFRAAKAINDGLSVVPPVRSSVVSISF